MKVAPRCSLLSIPLNWGVSSLRKGHAKSTLSPQRGAIAFTHLVIPEAGLPESLVSRSRDSRHRISRESAHELVDSRVVQLPRLGTHNVPNFGTITRGGFVGKSSYPVTEGDAKRQSRNRSRQPRSGSRIARLATRRTELTRTRQLLHRARLASEMTMKEQCVNPIDPAGGEGCGGLTRPTAEP